MTANLITRSKINVEAFYVVFPFESFLAPGEVLFDCEFEVEYFLGTSEEPADDIISGAAILTDTTAKVLVQGGIPGFIYLIKAEAHKRIGEAEPYEAGPETFVIQTKIAIADPTL